MNFVLSYQTSATRTIQNEGPLRVFSGIFSKTGLLEREKLMRKQWKEKERLDKERERYERRSEQG